MTLRLTKQRLAKLNAALSLDDVLYEKFRRMQEALKQEYQRFYRRQQVLEVRLRRDGYHEILQICEIVKTPDGMIVTVK